MLPPPWRLRWPPPAGNRAALNENANRKMKFAPASLGATYDAFFAACLGKAPILAPGEEALLALTLAVQAETLARSYSEAV